MRLVPSFAIALAGIAAAVCTSASAWGPDGHHTVGALADKLIAGKPAAAQVQALLGGLRLQNASVWADCARGVDPAQGYAYTTRGRYPECRIFETPELEAEMSDFVRRNDVNCDRRPSEESCHKQYHYTDIAIQRSRIRHKRLRQNVPICGKPSVALNNDRAHLYVPDETTVFGSMQGSVGSFVVTVPVTCCASVKPVTSTVP